MSGSDDKNKASVGSGQRWSGRTRGGVIGNYIFYFLLRWFGLRAAYILLFPVAFYFLFFAPDALHASNDYRRRIGYGSSSRLAQFIGAYKHFLNFGKILLDRAAIIITRASKFKIYFDGEEHMRSALKEGKGLILVSAHCGNWEGAAHLLERLDVPINIVAYQGEAESVRKFLGKALKGRCVSIIAADGQADSSIAIITALNRGEVVVMHADRFFSQHSLAVRFLGDYTRFPTGAFTIAALSGSPLICAFAMREGMYRYHFRAYPPEHLAFAGHSNREQLLREWISLYVSRLEANLREYPLQWHNFYDFWDSSLFSNKKTAGDLSV